MTLFRSRRGGGFESQSGTGRCTRGDKLFCFEDSRFPNLTRDCK